MTTSGDLDVAFNALPTLTRRDGLTDDVYAAVMTDAVLLWSMEARAAGRRHNDQTPIATVLAHHEKAGTVTVSCPFCLRRHQHPASEVGNKVPADKCSAFWFRGQLTRTPRGAQYRIEQPRDD